MVTITSHGGSCCGARHIYNFRENQTANIRGLITALRNDRLAGVGGFEEGAQRIPANGNLLLEVILSNRQTEQYPNLIRTLEWLGFVYDAAWNGQHGTPVHRFSRARNRLRLSANRFNWQGMMMGPNVGGMLPAFAEGLPPTRNGGPNVPFVVGDRVLCTATQSDWYNTVGQVVEIGRIRGFENDGIVVRFPFGVSRVMSPSSFRLEAGQRGVAAEPVEVRPTYRHPTLQLETLHIEGVAAPNPATVSIITEYYALFQNGKTTGPYPNREAVREANPRVLSFRQRTIYMDGHSDNNDMRF